MPRDLKSRCCCVSHSLTNSDCGRASIIASHSPPGWRGRARCRPITKFSRINGAKDFWVLRCDANGNKVEQLSLGGSDNDIGYAATVSKDGRYYFAGYSKSTDGDIKVNNHGDFDGWIFELGLSGVDTTQIRTQDTLVVVALTTNADIEMGISASLFVPKTQETEIFS